MIELTGGILYEKGGFEWLPVHLSCLGTELFTAMMFLFANKKYFVENFKNLL